MKIYIFSWNAQSVCFNSTNTDFIQILGDNIKRTNCDLAVIALQEDAIRDSELLIANDLISKELSNSYHKIAFEELSGWGVTTYKTMREEWRYAPRGLRLAIYKRGDSDLEISHIDTMRTVCPGIRDKITAGKGGIAINLSTNLGEFTFLNIHLPFNSRSIMRGDSIDRHSSVMWQANCFKQLYSSAIDKFNSDRVFVMGDFNFRVQIRYEESAKEIAQRILVDLDYLQELIKQADELTLLTNYSREQESVVPIMKEGVCGNGPVFYPTCKLKQGRKETVYSLGKENQRTPSWCDRILYDGDVTCNFYNRMDFGNMNLSDHAAVIGEFEITTFLDTRLATLGSLKK